MASRGQRLAGGQRQHGKTPINNQAQNKQVKSIAKQLKLSKGQQEELHETITGQGMSYSEILEEAKRIKNKGKEK